MGQFSWLDCKDPKRQILDNVFEDVYVLIPKEFGGGHIEESYYDGYGNFCGQDIYELVVDWNRDYLEEYRKNRDFCCDWLQQYGSVDEAFEKMEKREIGISIACYDDDNNRIHFPIKITHDPTAVYEECPPSLSDPNQGWPADDDDDDEYSDEYSDEYNDDDE